MPTNATPEYKTAEAAYRAAREPRERLECLKEMLRTIPKHKGTDHLQAEIKTKIKDLTDDLTAARRGGSRGGPPTVIRPEGAAQVSLLGPPNSGKSSLHHALTGSHAPVGPYPFTTLYPQPGMLHHLDITFQLVDLPPISAEHPVPWMANAVQPAHGCLLVVDLGEPACVDQVVHLHDILADRKVVLTPEWPDGITVNDEDPFTTRLPALMVATRADQVPNLEEELEALRELTGLRYPVLGVSATTRIGLDAVGPWLFRHLGVVRAYTKVPGRPPDMGRPYTLRRGQTVADVAALVHKEIAASLHYARLWGGAGPDGRQVGRDHPVSDGDVLELHA
jgi:ribosome-interacting GTPase 1